MLLHEFTSQMNTTAEKNQQKQEKQREMIERDRQLAVMRVARVVKVIDKSYAPPHFRYCLG